MSCRAPSRSLGTLIPRYELIREFHASGRALTLSLPSSISFSSSNRSSTCRLYVTSSASTRINDGYDLLTALKNASSSTPRSCSGNLLRRLGKKCFQNGWLRPTRFSQSRDCDSCTPGDAPPHSGVRSMSSPMPWLYIACPDSWIDPKRHSLKKSRETRVVMRTSPGPNEVEKGWV